MLSCLNSTGFNWTLRQVPLDYIVDKALEYNLGARGLRSLCESILNQAMFDLPGSEETELKVTKAYAEQQLKKANTSKLKAVS